MGILYYFSVASGLFALALAGFPPTPYGISKVQSKFHPGVYISYKEVLAPNDSNIITVTITDPLVTAAPYL